MLFRCIYCGGFGNNNNIGQCLEGMNGSVTT